MLETHISREFWDAGGPHCAKLQGIVQNLPLHTAHDVLHTSREDAHCREFLNSVREVINMNGLQFRNSGFGALG